MSLRGTNLGTPYLGTHRACRVRRLRISEHQRYRISRNQCRIYTVSSADAGKQQGTEGSCIHKPGSRRDLVVAVDYSQDSEYACRWAANTLARPGDVFHILHCIPFQTQPSAYVTETGHIVYVPVEDDDLERRHKETAHKFLSENYLPIFHAANVECTIDVVRESGAAAEAGVGDVVCRVAQETQASAVIMASHSKGPVAEFLLGSITSYCARVCPQPLLVLHNPGAAKPQGFLGPLKSLAQHLQRFAHYGETPDHAGAEHSDAVPTALPLQQQRHVLIAVDQSAQALEACQWAVDHMHQAGDKFHLVHVIPTVPDRVLYNHGEGLLIPAADIEEIERNMRQRMCAHEQLLQDHNVEYEVEILHECKDQGLDAIGSSICQRADALGVAAVVVSADQPAVQVAELLLGSVTNHLVHNCKQPVVVLH